jgi:hypothetical protein
MRHKIKLKPEERISAWLDLCDFCFNLMKTNLSAKEFARRLQMIRQEHKQKNLRILRGLAKAA